MAFLRRAYQHGLLYPAAVVVAYYALLLLVRPFAYEIGFAEWAVIMLATIVLSAVLAPRAIVRGLASAALGVLFGTVGIQMITGEVRYVFDQPWLWEGLPALLVLIGLFAIPLGLRLVRHGLAGTRGYSVVGVVTIAIAGGYATAVALGHSYRNDYTTIDNTFFGLAGPWSDLLWIVSVSGSFCIVSGLSWALLRRSEAVQARLALACTSGLGVVLIVLLIGVGVKVQAEWEALPFMAAFAGIGLLLHRHGWPRFPLFVGVIAGPPMENNYVSALNVVSGWVEIWARPLSLTLAVAVLAVAVASYLIARPRGPQAAVEPLRQSVGAAVLQWRNVVLLLGIAAGVAFFWGSLSFSLVETWLFPRLSATAVVALCLLQLFLNVRSPELPDAGPTNTDVSGYRDPMAIATYLAFGFLGLMTLLLNTVLLTAFYLRSVDGRSKSVIDHAKSRLVLRSARAAALPLGLGIAGFAVLTTAVGIHWGLAALAGTLPFLVTTSVRTRPDAAALGSALAGTALVVLARWASDVPALYLHLSSETALVPFFPRGLFSFIEGLGLVVGLTLYVMDLGHNVYLASFSRLLGPFGNLFFFLHALGVALLSAGLVLSIVRPAGRMPESSLFRVLASWQMLASLVVIALTLEAVYTVVS